MRNLITRSWSCCETSPKHRCQSIIRLTQPDSMGLTVLEAGGLVMSLFPEHVLTDMKTFAWRSGGQRSLD